MGPEPPAPSLFASPSSTPTEAVVDAGGAPPLGRTSRQAEPRDRNAAASDSEHVPSLDEQADEAMRLSNSMLRIAADENDPAVRASALRMAEAARQDSLDLKRKSALAKRPRPVYRVLWKKGLLRQPDVEEGRLPPDFDKIFVPHPSRPRAELAEKQVAKFWEETVELVTDALPAQGRHGAEPAEEEISPGRLPLLYFLSSFGRGKTFFLREATRYLHSASYEDGHEREELLQRVAGRGVVVLAANFNGSFKVQSIEAAALAHREDEKSINYYMLLYVRILFNELAVLNRPIQNFGDFLSAFYNDYQQKEFDFADVYAEVRAMVANRAGRGSRGDVVVLLVDEIGKLRAHHGWTVCSTLQLDICYPIRSECCSLVESGSGLGIAAMTAMDSAMMLAERSASGRPPKAMDYIPAGNLSAQRIRLMDAMRLGDEARRGEDAPEFSSPSWMVEVDSGGEDSTRLAALEAAEVYALLSGLLWRPVELFAIELKKARGEPLVDMMVSVEEQMATDSAGKVLGYGSLWDSQNSELRDHVLAASLLVDIVAEDELVLPQRSNCRSCGSGSNLLADEDVLGFADIGKLTREELVARRAELAERAWARIMLRTTADLTWGNVLALGFIFGPGGRQFHPAVLPLTLLRALDTKTASAPLAKLMATDEESAPSPGEVAEAAPDKMPAATSDAEASVSEKPTMSSNDASAASSYEMPADFPDRMSDAWSDQELASPNYEAKAPSGQSSLWRALRSFLFMTTASAEDECDSRGNTLNAKTKFDWCGWELFLLQWEYLISTARALRPGGGGWRSTTFAHMYGRNGRKVTFLGPSPLLSDVPVDATIERKGVVFLAGDGGRNARDGGAVTASDLFGGRVPVDEMLRTSYKLPNGAASFDGVCFYRANKTVPGVVKLGDVVAVFYQGKHSAPTSSTASGSDVQASLDLMCSKDGSGTEHAAKLFGSKEVFSQWRGRSVFVFACLRKVRPTVQTLTGPLASTTVVLNHQDLRKLLGPMLFSVARALYLLHPPQSVDSTKPGTPVSSESPAASPRTVVPPAEYYYVPAGKVYHLNSQCSHLTRAKGSIIMTSSGSPTPAGRRLCRLCSRALSDSVQLS